jgi:hypothetical protein
MQNGNFCLPDFMVSFAHAMRSAGELRAPQHENSAGFRGWINGRAGNAMSAIASCGHVVVLVAVGNVPKSGRMSI